MGCSIRGFRSNERAGGAKPDAPRLAAARARPTRPPRPRDRAALYSGWAVRPPARPLRPLQERPDERADAAFGRALVRHRRARARSLFAHSLWRAHLVGRGAVLGGA